MYPRVVRRRNKDGSVRSYLQLVEAYRTAGKVRQKVIGGIGRLDVVRETGALDSLIGSLARYSERSWIEAEAEARLAWSKLYGPALVFRRLWEHLDVAREVEALGAQSEIRFSLDEAAFALVLHRLVDPGSKRSTRQWLSTVYRPQFDGLELQHLYRTLDHLVRGKERLEEMLFARSRDLFSLAVDVVLFDTTLVHFQGRGPEGLAAFGRPGDYPDCVKVLVGLVLTGDGFPVAHHVFPGNTADISAFREALQDLRRRFRLRRVVVIGDRGMVSSDLMEELERDGVEYILGMRLRQSREVGAEVLARAGRYHEVADNLEVKEVRVGERRYIICRNPEEEVRDAAVRSEIIERTREDLKHKGPQSFIMPRGLRRFVKLVGGDLAVNEAAIEREARYDGKWVLKTNTDLPTTDAALAYKSLWQVESAFREMKSGLEVRPVFVRTDDHVRGHLVVCFLALVLEATLSRLLKDQKCTASCRQVMSDLEQMRAVRLDARGKAWLYRTELAGCAHEGFRAAGLRPPPHVQPLG